MKKDHSHITTPQDLIALDKFLRTQTKDMSLVKAHGFITCIVSFPELFMPSEWIPILVGELKFLNDHTPVSIMLEKLVVLYKQINLHLKSADSFKLLLSAEQPNLSIDIAPIEYIQEWCNGYCLALVWNEQEWLYAKEDFITKACATFFMLTDLINVNNDPNRTDEWEHDRKILVKNLPDLIKSLYVYWVGEKENFFNSDLLSIRNTTCPCGSAKAYSKCCLLEASEVNLH